MTLFINPYADYGTVIAGDRFIGREADMRTIRNRLLGAGAFGSLALMGMPRIGKSSLVYQVFLKHKPGLLANKVIVVQLSLGEYTTAEQLFADLVAQFVEEIKNAGLMTQRLSEVADKALASAPNRFANVKRFFEIARQQEIRCICVMDEFDSARVLFSGQRIYFHWLRELASNPQFKIGLITVSKRALSQIAIQSGEGDAAYWHNVFMDHRLSVFSEADVKSYYQRLDEYIPELDADVRKLIDYYCGRHPFYLDVFAFFSVDARMNTGRVEIDSILTAIRVPFQQEFANLVAVLSEDGQLKKLIQILFGPVLDVTESDLDLFMCYGLLQKESDGTYTAFSQYLVDYLRLIERGIDLWPLWTKTEKLLRYVMTAALTEKYGNNWSDGIEKAHSKLHATLDSLRTQQQKEHERFGDRASDSLLDYAYPMDLFSIITSEWSIFAKIFGKDKSYWNERFVVLSKVRTPMAHNRDFALLEYERDTAEGYCKEIVHLLESWYC